jgi:hypothetical protein
VEVERKLKPGKSGLQQDSRTAVEEGHIYYALHISVDQL